MYVYGKRLGDTSAGWLVVVLWCVRRVSSFNLVAKANAISVSVNGSLVNDRIALLPAHSLHLILFSTIIYCCSLFHTHFRSFSSFSIYSLVSLALSLQLKFHCRHTQSDEELYTVVSDIRENGKLTLLWTGAQNNGISLTVLPLNDNEFFNDLRCLLFSHVSRT